MEWCRYRKGFYLMMVETSTRTWSIQCWRTFRMLKFWRVMLSSYASCYWKSQNIVSQNFKPYSMWFVPILLTVDYDLCLLVLSICVEWFLIWVVCIGSGLICITAKWNVKYRNTALSNSVKLECNTLYFFISELVWKQSPNQVGYIEIQRITWMYYGVRQCNISSYFTYLSAMHMFTFWAPCFVGMVSQ